MFVGPLRRLPASASESRSCPSWATHNGSVYLFGGYDGGGASLVCLSAFERWKLVKKSGWPFEHQTWGDQRDP